MSLKFPNARLHIHELLTLGGLSGRQAIAKAACDFGLISSNAAVTLDEFKTEGCGCVEVVRKVLETCLEDKALYHGRPLADASDAWDEIERSAKAYLQSTVCETLAISGKPGCARLAPVLFDLLLQQLGRYY